MSTTKGVGLSKLDVAKRELEHSIELFFNYGDFVIIHLSSCAAQEILSGIGKASNVTSMRSEMKKYVKPEKLKYVQQKINEPYNFFKHANTDPDKLLKFSPTSSEFNIWDCINMYQQLTHEITGLMTAFRLWFYMKHKDLLIGPNQEAIDLIKKSSQEISIEDRSFFLEAAHKLESQRTIGAKL
jgi:hypothetical protein